MKNLQELNALKKSRGVREERIGAKAAPVSLPVHRDFYNNLFLYVVIDVGKFSVVLQEVEVKEKLHKAAPKTNKPAVVVKTKENHAVSDNAHAVPTYVRLSTSILHRKCGD